MYLDVLEGLSQMERKGALVGGNTFVLKQADALDPGAFREDEIASFE